METLTLALVAVAFGALTGLSHYVVPRLAGRSKLPNVARFIIGVVLGILAPFVVWVAVTGGDWMYVVALAACSIGAGAFTCAAYLTDWIGGVGGLTKMIKHLLVR
jgi:MFS family permease